MNLHEHAWYFISSWKRHVISEKELEVSQIKFYVMSDILD